MDWEMFFLAAAFLGATLCATELGMHLGVLYQNERKIKVLLTLHFV